MEVMVGSDLKLPHAPTKPLLRPHQMVQHEEDLRQCDADMVNPRLNNSSSKKNISLRRKKLEAQFNAQAPQPITDPLTRDKVAKAIKNLEEQIRVGMPTEEEMRKASNVTVEQHRRWERANKKKIGVWRNLQRQLATDTSDPDTWDRSLGDTERLRPRSVDTSRYRADTLIPGAFSMSDLPAENWDAIFDSKPNSALEQAKKVQDEQQAEAKPKAKRTMSPEQKAAAAERLKKARAVAAMKRQAAQADAT